VKLKRGARTTRARANHNRDWRYSVRGAALRFHLPRSESRALSFARSDRDGPCVKFIRGNRYGGAGGGGGAASSIRYGINNMIRARWAASTAQMPITSATFISSAERLGPNA